MKGLALSGRADNGNLTVHDIPRDPSSKEYVDFRDRAAYVHLTGTFPTHVRKYFTGLLRAATDYVKGPASVDRRFGHIKVNEEVVSSLRLEEHPMVRKVRHMVEKEGYVIAQAPQIKQRRPFGKINLIHPRTNHEVVVQSDGSVLDG